MRSFEIENELIGSNEVKIIMYDYNKHVEKKNCTQAFSCNRTACTLAGFRLGSQEIRKIRNFRKLFLQKLVRIENELDYIYFGGPPGAAWIFQEIQKQISKLFAGLSTLKNQNFQKNFFFSLNSQ